MAFITSTTFYSAISRAILSRQMITNSPTTTLPKWESSTYAIQLIGT